MLQLTGDVRLELRQVEVVSNVLDNGCCSVCAVTNRQVSKGEVERPSLATPQTGRGCAPHEACEETNPIQVEGEVVRPPQREDSECLGFVLAVDWVAKLRDIIVLESMGDLLLVGVLSLKYPGCLSSVRRVVVKVCHIIQRSRRRVHGTLLGHSS